MKTNEAPLATQMLKEAEGALERMVKPTTEEIRRQHILEETIVQGQRARCRLRERIIAVG